MLEQLETDEIYEETKELHNQQLLATTDWEKRAERRLELQWIRRQIVDRREATKRMEMQFKMDAQSEEIKRNEFVLEQKRHEIQMQQMQRKLEEQRQQYSELTTQQNQSMKGKKPVKEMHLNMPSHSMAEYASVQMNTGLNTDCITNAPEQTTCQHVDEWVSAHV